MHANADLYTHAHLNPEVVLNARTMNFFGRVNLKQFKSVL